MPRMTVWRQLKSRWRLGLARPGEPVARKAGRRYARGSREPTIPLPIAWVSGVPMR